MEDRIGGRVDPDTKTMLKELVDKERKRLIAREGAKVTKLSVTETSMLISLIRDKHEQEFPDRWDDMGYKFYTKMASAS